MMRGRIAVSFDNTISKSRYRSPVDTKQFKPMVEHLASAEIAFIEIVAPGGWQVGKRTAIRAAQRLCNWIDSYDIDITDVCMRDDEEIVIQKTDKHDPENLLEGRAEYVDYIDTWRSKKYRKQMQTINEFIAKADIDYSGTRMVDLSNRKLRRVFNNSSFTQGGRLAGGFWMGGSRFGGLSKKQRKNITINGQATVEVDFTACQAAIGYAVAGVKFDIWKDAYDIEGFDKSERQGIKKLFASMLYARKPLTRWPRNTSHLFTPATKLAGVIKSIQQAHPALDTFWFKGHGFRWMFTESEILVQTLLKCVEEGIPALPIHDCLRVREKDARRAAAIMEHAFEVIAKGNVRLTISSRPYLRLASDVGSVCKIEA